MKTTARLLGCSALLGAVLLLAGCGGGGGTYWLTLDYPSETNLDDVVGVEVFALKASTDATCGALMGGTPPTDFGDPKVAYFSSPNPADASIKGLSSGAWVFFVRVKDADGVFLQGCADVDVGTDEDITITLQAV